MERDSQDVWFRSVAPVSSLWSEEVSMLDPRTLWLTLPEDRYEPTPALRRAERALFPLLRSTAAPRPVRSSGLTEVGV